MAEVKVGDDLFHVELDGQPDGPVLMLSNSLGTNLRMWDAQMPELTKHFHVVRYDSRGHGKSAAPEGPYSIEQLGGDAISIMDDLGFAKVHWLGLSKGGMVGQWLLTHHPDRIDRAVLANTAAQAGSPDVWNARIRAVREGGMEAVASSVIERWFTAEFQKRAPDAVGRILDMLHATPPQGYLGCVSAIRDMDQRESIRGITNPVLVIVGDQDPATPPEAGELIAGNIPGAELVTLKAAHLSNVEQEAAFTDAVLSFLTRRTPDRPRHSVSKKTTKNAKTAAKKAVKHASKKASKKTSKKAAKKSAKKAMKKAPKKAQKKIAKAAKKVAKKAVKKIGRAKSFARTGGRPIRGRTR